MARRLREQGQWREGSEKFSGKLQKSELCTPLFSSPKTGELQQAFLAELVAEFQIHALVNNSQHSPYECILNDLIWLKIRGFGQFLKRHWVSGTCKNLCKRNIKSSKTGAGIPFFRRLPQGGFEVSQGMLSRLRNFYFNTLPGRDDAQCGIVLPAVRIPNSGQLCYLGWRDYIRRYGNCDDSWNRLTPFQLEDGVELQADATRQRNYSIIAWARNRVGLNRPAELPEGGAEAQIGCGKA